jgi:oxygen-independent coproporphyrinogen III oxidase
MNFVLSQGVNHISCYALTVEPKTPLEKKIRLQQAVEVDATQQSRQFFQLMKKMEEAGFEHYEISNFAKPGHRSRHNSSYWKGIPYLGLGPSAHSFNGHSRQWNIANNLKYTASILNGKIPFEKEELTPVQKINEYIMTSLRLMEGCNLNVAEKEFGPGKKETLLREAQRFIDLKWITYEQEHLKLTAEGKLFADKIAAELFF